jgi:chromosome segregation ATPase
MKMKANSLTVSQQPRLRRGLFGIRSHDVWTLLDDREEELGRIRDRADSAGSENASLREQIASLEAKLDQAHHELTLLRELDPHTAEGDGSTAKFCDCPPSDSLLEEMTKAVATTEEATQRILHHARETLMKEIEAAEALRKRAKSEISEAGAWRRHWGPILKGFQATVKETASTIEDVPERVREALGPLTAAAAALDEDLRQFAAFEVTMAVGSHEDPIVVEDAEERSVSDGDPVVITDESDPAPISS